tara:strand:+ start:418 stop:645 length:228 start_codon:yes stop_codon:yes gene_type:complete
LVIPAQAELPTGLLVVAEVLCTRELWELVEVDQVEEAHMLVQEMVVQEIGLPGLMVQMPHWEVEVEEELQMVLEV